jgi:UDP-N-acetylmuramate-alanine ligase
MKIFGKHNLQNLMGAMKVASVIGVSSKDFLSAMEDFNGANKRLEKVIESERLF